MHLSVSALRTAVHRLAGALIVVAMGSWAAGAQAQEQADPEALAHFEAGTEAFDSGDYERAVEEFRATYALTPHPDVLFNIYSAAERAGQLQSAEEALVRYLADGEIEAERRPVLEERLARLRERIASQDAEPEPEPEPETQPEPEPEPEPQPEAPAPSGGGVHPAGIGVLAGAGALLVSFAVFAGLSSAEDSALAERCATEACDAGDVETLNTFNIAADVSWIGAATLGVVGLVLLLALPPEGAADADVAVAPWASPEGGGLVVGGSL